MSAKISTMAHQLRTALEQARAADADIPWLSRFPTKCCNFTSNLLVLTLSDAGVSCVKRVIGTVTDEKGDDIGSHVWVVADGVIVDIAADCYGQAAVVVAESSEWHSSLDEVKPFIERIDRDDGIDAEELSRLRDLYQETLQVLAVYRDN